MAKKKGIDVVVKKAGNIIGGQRGASLTFNQATADVTDVEGGGWKEFLPTLREWKIGCEGAVFVTETAFTACQTAMLTGSAAFTLSFDAGTSGIFTGTGIITELAENATIEGALTYTLGFQGTGDCNVS